MLPTFHNITSFIKMCNIGALVSVWKPSPADLICMKGFHGRSYGIEGKFKNAGNFKCVERNASFRCVIFLEAVLVGFNYLNYI